MTAHPCTGRQMNASFAPLVAPQARLGRVSNIAPPSKAAPHQRDPLIALLVSYPGRQVGLSFDSNVSRSFPPRLRCGQRQSGSLCSTSQLGVLCLSPGPLAPPDLRAKSAGGISGKQHLGSGTAAPQMREPALAQAPGLVSPLLAPFAGGRLHISPLAEPLRGSVYYPLRHLPALPLGKALLSAGFHLLSPA